MDQRKSSLMKKYSLVVPSKEYLTKEYEAIDTDKSNTFSFSELKKFLKNQFLNPETNPHYLKLLCSISFGIMNPYPNRSLKQVDFYAYLNRYARDTN